MKRYRIYHISGEQCSTQIGLVAAYDPEGGTIIDEDQLEAMRPLINAGRFVVEEIRDHRNEEESSSNGS